MNHVTMVCFRTDLELVRAALLSLESQSRPPRMTWILSSADAGEGDAIEEMSNALRLNVDVTRRPDNLGFAGGHNFLAARAFSAGAAYVTVMNPDIRLSADALDGLLAAVDGYPRALAVHGPHLLEGAARGGGSRGGGTTVDSAGIVWSADGRHFDALQGAASRTLPVDAVVRHGVSGALLVVGRETYLRLHEQTGCLFDNEFLAYREDAELGVRVRAIGGVSVVHPVSGFVHSRGARNRQRTSQLQRALGVRNRFFIRWKLGSLRPGVPLLATARDVLVVLAVVIQERSSLPALGQAWRLRRTMKYRRRRLVVDR